MTPTPYAILDIHFSPHDPSLLAVAASTGLLELFRFDTLTSTLKSEKVLQFFDSTILVLSLAWHPTRESLVGVTLSNGEVHLCDASSTADIMTEPTMLNQHDLEAWTLSFPASGMSVFSGGDDATLRFSDDILNAAANGPGVQWSDRRIHGAGVTAILPLAKEDNVTITGSYDDHIRVVYTPHVGRKQVLAEENLDGGVWRLKVLAEEPSQGRYGRNFALPSVLTLISGRYTILASCMHAGARIVDIQRDADNQWQITVLAKFEEHKSMNYGSDYQPSGERSKAIVSTSFYDKLLCLWRYDTCHRGLL